MMALSLFFLAVEAIASLITAGALTAIAIHEIWGSNGWRAKGKGE